MPQPTVSVVMCVYNGRPYLEEAVQSVLDQTFEDFEFIIINDGSTDGSKELLDRFGDRDDRIHLVHQENQGISPSLNRGLHLARGKYIARMDADDISHPERFERQVGFLDDHPEVGIVGTQIDLIDSTGQIDGHWPLFPHPEVVGWKLLFSTPLCHSSILGRKALFQDLGGYAEWATYAQDYELYTRAILRSHLANLPCTLHKKRRLEHSITGMKRREQIKLCCEAAVPLHRAVLEREVDASMAHFFIWMNQRGIEHALEETGVNDLYAIHNYGIKLYRAYVKRFLSSESTVRVRQHAYRELRPIATKISESEGWSQGLRCKIRTGLMRPYREVVPWLWETLRRKVSPG